MRKNENLVDRFIRIIASFIIMFAAYVMLTGFWQLVAYAVSAILAISAATGISFLYILFTSDND